ncbi:MAG: hypothetical protein KME14_15530 [Tildeniella torsiva UHER 1998/13D]|jgi:hypothetical protein|nr:hypothetical protein [Tildeniella torsiva UHER 1998/13D]
MPVVPPSVAAVPPPRNESVLSEIECTRVLRVALRKDAPPFGYINQDSAWARYCGNFAIALQRSPG